MKTFLISAFCFLLSALSRGQAFSFRDPGFAGQRSNPGIPGMIGWWRLNEGSGTIAYDSSGHGHTGTLVNSPSWITSPTHGLTFAWTSAQCVDIVGSGAVADNLSAFSVTLWYKTTVEPGGTFDESCPIAKLSTGGIETGNGWSVQFDQPNVFGGIQNNSGATWVGWIQGDAFPSLDGNWHLMVLTVSGTLASGIALYLDNGLQLDADNNGTWSDGFSNSHDIVIGGTGYSTDYYTGSLDDVRIYDHVLSSTERTALYDGGAP